MKLIKKKLKWLFLELTPYIMHHDLAAQQEPVFKIFSFLCDSYGVHQLPWSWGKLSIWTRIYWYWVNRIFSSHLEAGLVTFVWKYISFKTQHKVVWKMIHAMKKILLKNILITIWDKLLLLGFWARSVNFKNFFVLV